jgi:hypothetical protein
VHHPHTVLSFPFGFLAAWGLTSPHKVKRSRILSNYIRTDRAKKAEPIMEVVL